MKYVGVWWGMHLGVESWIMGDRHGATTENAKRYIDFAADNTRNSPQRKKWNDNDKGNSRVNTTLAKQLANWVILYSPLQMASDMIEHYEGHPAFQFFRDFNPDFDWSEALQGEPGESVAIVRRAEEDFFLGATTNGSARSIEIPLTFLEKGKQYKATIYADGDDAHWETNPTSYKIEKKNVSSSDTLFIEMAAGGGCAVIFGRDASNTSCLFFRRVRRVSTKEPKRTFDMQKQTLTFAKTFFLQKN